LKRFDPRFRGLSSQACSLAHKVALTLAVIGAVLGEYVAAERGLGYVQLQANANFDTTLNFAPVISIALLGVGPMI